MGRRCYQRGPLSAGQLRPGRPHVDAAGRDGGQRHGGRGKSARTDGLDHGEGRGRDHQRRTDGLADGIVDKIRVTEGVEVAIFVYQLSDDVFKFSLRSVSYVDVSKIAVAFGGGGHIRASGFEAKGDYNKNFNIILDMIKEQL